MEFVERRRSTPPNASVRIIAAGVVFGFCYWASTVMITLLVSILFAYLLDPLVELFEKFRVPRGVGSLMVVLLSLAVLGVLIWGVADRADQFGKAWPEYSAVLKRATGAVQERLQKIEMMFAEIAGQQKSTAPAAPAPREESPVRSLLLRGLGGLYTALLALSFIPFLVFFMLAGKRDLWHGTMQLFPPSERTRVRDALEAVSRMLRGFIVGNLIVALILATLSAIFFRIVGLDYPILLGIVSGVLNLVPYIGVVLAWLPPLLIGLTKFQIWGLVGIAVVLSVLHLMAINFLVPALVGRKVHLNALTVTLGLLFWGWLWGGMGLILAIPIMATIKVVCDHVEDWQPVGRWLGT